MFVALLQEYLHKHQKTISAQAENKQNSSISYGNYKKKKKAITAPFSYGGRRIKSPPGIHLESCLSDWRRDPCTWVGFLPLHTQLSLNLIQMSSMTGRQNHGMYILQGNKYSLSVLNLFFKRPCMPATGRICNNTTNATNLFNIHRPIHCLSDHSEQCINCFILPAQRSEVRSPYLTVPCLPLLLSSVPGLKHKNSP